MNRRREHILTLIQRAEDPLGVEEVARRLGVHPNTARFHLDALVEQGSIARVERTNEHRGRGRPAACLAHLTPTSAREATGVNR